MCGIVGIFSKSEKIDAKEILAMTNTIIHRGPDGSGYLCSENVINQKILGNNHAVNLSSDISFAFGHRRLAIHDLSDNGLQPMCYKNRYWIVFNGEIYNYIELREELKEKGYQFNSDTDTEVIMAAYDCWGKDCLNKFNGMWAFVILDIRTDSIFVSRDRFGIKPLYFYQDENIFIFASEIKAIIECTKVVRAPNITYIKEFIKNESMEYIEQTAFDSVMRFPFAHYSMFSLKNAFKPASVDFINYWNVKPNTKNVPAQQNELENYADKFITQLKESVRIRLLADVKVGSALSGGLDSSTIVTLVNGLLNEKGICDQQETFSNIYKETASEECDESQFIEEVAQSLNVKSNQIEPRVADVISEHKKMIYHLECPPDNTLMSSWHTFKLVGESDVTVTLDGQGADEQLCGYLGYYLLYFSQAKMSDFFRIKKHLLKVPNISKHYFSGLVINVLSKFIGRTLTQKLWNFIGRKENVFEPINLRLWNDFTKNLVNLLHFADSTSMAFSIESRMPFMDHQLVELLFSVPASYKLYNGWTKYLARYAVKNMLPPSVVWRKDKKGWPIPEEMWFSGELKSWLDKSVLESKFFEKNEISLDDYKNFNLAKKIKFLNLAVWHKVYFNDKDSQG